MIADLKPYSEYKASSQAWLGKIPQHWSLLPNRALFAEVKDRNHPNEEMLSVTITRGIVRQKVLIEGSSKKDSSNLDKSAYKLVQPRDIAYNKMRAWQGAIGASTLRGIISPAYVVMRLRKDDDLPYYFHHLYRTPQFAKEAERWSYGITSDMWSLRPEHFKMIYTPEPPPDEQAVIVRFLDWVNGRLDRTIRAKQQVIALLKEQKQVIIHRAVTRGLDPSVPLKPSDIFWLGDIPEEWKLCRLKLLVQVKDGTHDTPMYRQPGANTYPLITSRHIVRGTIQTDRANHISKDDYKAIIQRSNVTINDIIMPMIGTIGNPCIVENTVPFAIKNVALFKTSTSKELLPAFLVYLLESPLIQRQFDDLERGGVQGFVSLGVLRNLLVPKLGREDQAAIVSSLDTQLINVNTAISRLEREIELLREYRIRLVADVVTGKLDVREVAARLPEEAVPDTIEEDTYLFDDPEASDEEDDI